jgi:hypothetical protein
MTAAVLYQGIHRRNSPLAQEREVPLALGHCLIELRDDIDPITLARDLVPGAIPGATSARIPWMKVRAHELCRTGDLKRAQRLLRFIAAFDTTTATTYVESFIKGRSGCWERYLDGSGDEPGFLQVNRWSDRDIAAMKSRSHGLKVLIIEP